MVNSSSITMSTEANNLHWFDICPHLRMGRCLLSHCERGWSIGREWSAHLADLDLWVVVSGVGRLRAGDAHHDLHPGVALLMRPGIDYEAHQDEDHRLSIYAVHFEMLNRRGKPLRDGRLPSTPFDVPDVAAAGAACRRIFDRYHTVGPGKAWTTDPVAVSWLRSLLLDLTLNTQERLASLDGNEAHHRHLVGRAESSLRENPANPPTIAELARQAGYSPSHFSRVFRKITGYSPQTAMVNARIDRARHLLRTTPMTVSQVADALNYSDLYFFSRQFKKFTGQSPRQYRQDARRNPLTVRTGA